MKGNVIAVISVALALSGCVSTAPRYWHEAPQTDGSAAGQWQGMVRSTLLQSSQLTRLHTWTRVMCDRYADRMDMVVDGSSVTLHLGRSPVFTLKAHLDENGHFQTAVPVTGDTSVDGSVPIFTHQPMLTVGGQLDASSGLAWGRLKMGPNDSMPGCFGQFQLAKGAAVVAEDQLGDPFHIKYWIQDLSEYDQWW